MSYECYILGGLYLFNTMDANKKHLSALVYVAVMIIMLFGVQRLERSCSVQGSWECKRPMCNLHPMRSRCTQQGTYLNKFLYLTQAAAKISCYTFLSLNKYHTNLITTKESNHDNKVHMVKTNYTVYARTVSI